MFTHRPFLSIYALFSLFLSLSFCVNAVERDGIHVSLGGFYSNIESSIGSKLIGGNKDIQGQASFESDLLLEDTSTQPLLELEWNFEQLHLLSVNYFSLDREGSVLNIAEFPIGDKDFKAGTLLNTRLDLNLWQLRYGYAFHQDAASEWGVTGGLHLINFAIDFNGIVAAAGSGGGGSADVSAATGFSNTVPLPNIGTFYNYKFSNNLRARLDAQYFDISVDTLDARMIALDAGIEYYPEPNISLYAGLSYYDVTARYTQDLEAAVDIDWDIKLKYWGPQLAVGYKF